jgi:hypothetical protein
VAIEELRRISSALTRDDARGIEHLIGDYRSEQQAGNETLARALQEAEESGLRERLLALAQAAKGSQ